MANNLSINVPVRSISDLQTVPNTGVNSKAMAQVKIPVGNLPTGVYGEALSLEQLANVMPVTAETQALVADESSRAQAAEKSIRTKINAESTRAQTAEKTLTQAVTQLYSGAAKVFTTYDLAVAAQSSLNPNSLVYVTSDPDDSKNNAYTWDGVNFVKTNLFNNGLAQISSSPDKLFIISDLLGNEVFSIDLEGNLSNQNKQITELIDIDYTPDESIVIHDKKGNILASLDNNGQWLLPSLRTHKLSLLDDLATNSGGDSDITEVETITLPESKYLRLNFVMNQNPPTDTGASVVPGQVEFLTPDGSVKYFTANMQLSVQGAGSAGDFKKNYTLDLFNSNNDSLAVKIGDTVAVDSFHLKGFYRDPSHMRDQGGYRLWKNLVSSLDYPASKINNNVYSQSISRPKDADFTADAKYFPYGFPVEVYLNNNFYGLYTLRLKKSRQNYALDNSNLNHIFLDSGTWYAYLNGAFDYKQWEIKSPKMKGYDDLGAIPSKFSSVQTNIERLFNFTKDLKNTYANHADYINLNQWLVFYINCELIGDIDHNGNNYNLITWDGKHWTILPYDLDWTLNWWFGSGTPQSGFLLSVDIWQNFRNVYAKELKAAYTQLRTSKALTVMTAAAPYQETISSVPRNIFAADKARWGIFDAFATSNYPNLEQVYAWFDARIKYLDSQWLN